MGSKSKEKMKRMLRRALRLYTYFRLGVVNYLGIFIALFNTSNLLWGFTPIHRWIPLSEFLVIFIVTYVPIAATLGYYDLKKGVNKTMAEINPFWKRATFIEKKWMVGAWTMKILPMMGLKDVAPKTFECLQRALISGIEWGVSKGKKLPKETCICEALKEEGLIDEETYKKCLEVALSER